ncbi:transporter substrate-binding domain-containing protein [Shewanella sp. 30m-9]
MRNAFLVFFLFVFSLPVIADQENKDSHLPNAEQVIRVGYPVADWQPFTYIGKDGNAIGLLPSILQEITKNSGYRTEVVTYPNYQQVTQALRNREIDIIMGASKTPERMTWLSFSSPLMLVPIAGITYQENTNSLFELKGLRIATEKGFAINEQLRNGLNSVKVINYTDSLSAYKAVLNGSSDAYISNAITLDYLLTHQYAPKKLNIRLLNDMPLESLHFAGLIENNKLIERLNDGLKQIPSETFDKLYEAWLTSSQVKYIYQHQGLNLTESESNAIRDKKVIKVLYSADSYPFTFTNDAGEMDGMGADILKAISNKLNLKIEATEFNGQNIEKYLAENEFELIPAFTCVQGKHPFTQCTTAYIQDPWIAVAATNLATGQLETTKRLGILSRHEQQIDTKKDFPYANVTRFNTTKHLLNAVINGKVQVGILPLSKASRVISARYLGKIQILTTPIEQQSRPVSFAVNKINPALLSVIDKTKHAIDKDELQAITHKWNNVSIDSDFSFEKIPNWLLLVLGGIFTLFLVIAYSNRKLKAEIAQRQSIEKELRLVNNNFGGVVAQLIRYGDDIEDISWSFISGNIEKYFGLTPNQLYQAPHLLMEFLAMHADEHGFLTDIEESRFRDSLYTTMKLNIDGKISWYQLTGTCTKEDRNKHWTYTLVDITVIKEKQAELDEARLIAESATVAKSRFLAMMSHEIRTPISGILSLLELMAPHLNSNELYGIHKNLTHSGSNLLNIVNDVLDFSKIEAGKLELSPDVCQLSSFICELVQPHIAHIERKGLKFKLWLDPKLSYSLTLDNLRLKQVLNNLLNNASKFTTEGEIWLSVGLLSATDKEQTITFAVTDSGIGIREEDISKLFLPFEQVDLSSERRFNGTGLGLSICEQLVKLMGGEISVTSTNGQGSTFRFNLTLPTVAVEIPTIVNKRCGIIVTDESNYNLFSEYLINWHCTTFNLLGTDNKTVLASYVATQKLEVLLLCEAWCEQQSMTPSWINHNIPGVQVILLKNKSMLSPTPATLGWALSVNPLIPLHLLHLMTKPEFFKNQYIGMKGDIKLALTREQAIAQNKLILVAEDHPINQDVIRMQLSKLGYFADIFDNGQQALTAYQQTKYMLLLTDCHMPELDGYGLVSAIRDNERQKQLPRLPVIALTANAMSSERNRCHQLGFDDYLIKPVTLQQLQTVLSSHIKAAADNVAHLENAENVDNATYQPCVATEEKVQLIIDIAALEANFGDLAICISLLNKFVTTSVQDVAALNQAVVGRDFIATAHHAHKLKGAAGVIECERLATCCSEIEKAASTQDIDTVQRQLAQLKQLMSQISTQVKRLT